MATYWKTYINRHTMTWTFFLSSVFLFVFVGYFFVIDPPPEAPREAREPYPDVLPTLTQLGIENNLLLELLPTTDEPFYLHAMDIVFESSRAPRGPVIVAYNNETICESKKGATADTIALSCSKRPVQTPYLFTITSSQSLDIGQIVDVVLTLRFEDDDRKVKNVQDVFFVDKRRFK